MSYLITAQNAINKKRILQDGANSVALSHVKRPWTEEYTFHGAPAIMEAMCVTRKNETTMSRESRAVTQILRK